MSTDIQTYMDIVSNFLGVAPDGHASIDKKQTVIFNFESERMKYSLSFDHNDMAIHISADFTMPFCGQSLVEVYAHWQSLAIEPEAEFYGDTPILVFRNEEDEMTLKFIKWPSGDCSIWPNYVK